MTEYFANQCTAIHEAQRRKIAHFDTPFVMGEGWTIAHASGPQAEWAEAWAVGKMTHRYCSVPGAFVVHVGERNNRPLIVISCRPDELTPEDNVPPEFIVEAQVPSLWLSDKEIANRYGIKIRRNGGATGDSTTDARLNPELRSRSTFEGSPVKFVHGMCDDMHTAGLFDRKQAIANAMDAGVTKNTATAQVYRWRKNNDM